MRILVVDDHVLVREGLRGVLDELQPGAVILEAADCREATRFIGEFADLELVLLDLGLPDTDGFTLLRDLRQRHPSLPIVVLSALQDRASVTQALDLGAAGFIPKSAHRAVMLGALRLVFAGGIYVPPEILRDDRTGSDSSAWRESRLVSPQELGLTARQLEVLALMLRGNSNKEICRTLVLSEQTVKNHVSAVLRALRVKSRAEAIVAASRLKWDVAAARE